MVDRNYIINLMKSKNTTIEEFNYDNLYCPPIASLFTQEDIYNLKRIATSLRYSARLKAKYQEIDKIMRSRGFVKLSAGTNRLCYRYIENDSFVVKIAYDSVGMNDNPREFFNQQLLKPFCTRVFEVAGDGVIATVERVNPITSREEFISVAEDVFTLLNDYIIGEYIMEDIGTKYFMNFGIRRGFGIVLLDFPYLFRLDGKKLFCIKPDPLSETGTCDGIIDYDAGFNKLQCTKCGAIYRANELSTEIKNNNIILREKGELKMELRIKGGTHNVSKVVGNEVEPAKYIPTKETNNTKKDQDNTVVVKEDSNVFVNGKPDRKNNSVSKSESMHTKDINNDNKKNKSNKSSNDKKVSVATEEKKATKPIKFNDDTDKLTRIDHLKISNNELDKYLGLIASSDNMDDKEAAKKTVVEFIVKNISKYKELFTSEDITDIINALINEFYILLNSNLENKNIVVSASIYNKFDSVVAENLGNIAIKVLDDNEEGEITEHSTNIEELDTTSEEMKEKEEVIQLVGASVFSAKVIDLQNIFTNVDHQDVIVVEDDNGEFLTVGNLLLAISKINEKDVESIEFAPKNYISQLKEYEKALEQKVNDLTADLNQANSKDMVEEDSEEEVKTEVPVGIFSPNIEFVKDEENSEEE